MIPPSPAAAAPPPQKKGNKFSTALSHNTLIKLCVLHLIYIFFKILLQNTKIQCTYTQTSSAMVLNHRAEFYFPVQGLRIAIDRLEEICGKIDRRFQGVRKSSASFITAEGRRGVSYYLLYLSRSNGFRRFIIFSLTIWVFSTLSSLFILL